MTLYILDQWEHNGRDDSDWYAVYYDDQTDTVDRGEIGTTRFACAIPQDPPVISKHINGEWQRFVLQKPTEEIIVKARQALARDQLYQMVKLDVERRHDYYPDVGTLSTGMLLRLDEDHRCHAKTVERTPCTKCSNNPGKWINPNNPQDIRICFACKGKGFFERNSSTKKDDGKITWIKVAKDSIGKVISHHFYGVTYRNGYNRPSGHNVTVYMKFDGTEQDVAVPLHKLRITEPRPTEEEMKEKAILLSKSSSAFYVPFRTSNTHLR